MPIRGLERSASSLTDELKNGMQVKDVEIKEFVNDGRMVSRLIGERKSNLAQRQAIGSGRGRVTRLAGLSKVVDRGARHESWLNTFVGQVFMGRRFGAREQIILVETHVRGLTIEVFVGMTGP